MNGRVYLGIWTFSLTLTGLCVGLVFGGESVFGSAGAFVGGAIFLLFLMVGGWIVAREA